MSCIETLIVLARTAFYLAVMPWGKRPDKLMPDPILCQMKPKECGFVFVSRKTIGKLSSVISLNTLDPAGESLHQMIKKHGRGTGRYYVPKKLPQNASVRTRQWPCTGRTVCR